MTSPVASSAVLKLTGRPRPELVMFKEALEWHTMYIAAARQEVSFYYAPLNFADALTTVIKHFNFNHDDVQFHISLYEILWVIDRWSADSELDGTDLGKNIKDFFTEHYPHGYPEPSKP